MKIFGSYNTKSKSSSLRHQVAKLFLDRSNGCLCVNKRLLELLEIGGKETAFIYFIEDDKGKFGICKTLDEEKGIPLYWYKTDTRARMFNSTIVEYIMNKFKLTNIHTSYHIVFYQLPVTIEKLVVYQIREITPYQRHMVKR